MARNSIKFDAASEQYLYGQNLASVKSHVFGLLLFVFLLSGCGGDAQNAGDPAANGGPTDPEPPSTGSSIPVFSQPQKISTDSGANVVDFQLVVDANSRSTTTVVWRQHDGVRHNLFASKYAEGNGFWSLQPVPLAVNNGDVADVEIVVDNNGSVTVVWTQDMGTHYGLWANFYDWNTSRWREPVLIEGSSGGDVGSILLTVDNSRRVTVLWTQADAMAEEQLWVNRFHPNEGVAGTWRGATQVSDSANGKVSSMTIAPGRSGGMLLLWTQLNAEGSFVDLWARRDIPPQGGIAWSSSLAQRLDSEDKGNVMPAAAVVDFSGDYTVVWGQYDGNRQDLWTARYSNSVWAEATKMETQDLGSVDVPWLFIDAADVITALWLQHDGTLNQLWTRRYENDVWSMAQALGNGDGHISALQVVAEDSGKVAVAWLQSRGTEEDLWADYFDGDDWGTAQLIETANTGSATTPSLFLDRSGNVSVIWRQRGADRIDLWANRYSVGSGWASAVRLETWDDGDVVSAPVGAVDSAGRITTLWRQRHESQEHLLISQYNLASDRWSEPNKVAESQATGGLLPQLEVDNTDKLTVIWLQPVNERVELWGNRL